MVGLPDPLGLRKPVIAPAGAVKDMSRTAVARPKPGASRSSLSAVIDRKLPALARQADEQVSGACLVRVDGPALDRG